MRHDSKLIVEIGSLTLMIDASDPRLRERLKRLPHQELVVRMALRGRAKNLGRYWDTRMDTLTAEWPRGRADDGRDRTRHFTPDCKLRCPSRPARRLR
jgi:hypothetical protein